MIDINILAVIACTVSSFALGGLWYSPIMFLKSWTKESGQVINTQAKHPSVVFIVSILLAFISSLAFAFWLGPNPVLSYSLAQSLIVGVCFVAASFGINYQFANKSTKLLLIDAGYHIIQFLLYGLILGLWH